MAGRILKIGGGRPRGSNTQVQYNNTGAFGGCAQLFWDNANDRLGLGDSTPAKQLSITKCIEMLESSASDVGVVYKGADRFIHDFRAAGACGNNTFLGVNAGNFSMAIAGSADHASRNVGVGVNALQSLTTGFRNIGIGFESLKVVTAGCDNVGFGAYCGYKLTTGCSNLAMGYGSLCDNVTGSDNVAIGDRAGRSAVGQSISSNVLVGSKAGYGLIAGGDNNIMIGYQAGDNVTSGEQNIIIGYNLNALAAASDYQLSIGGLIFGDLGGTKKVGVNTSTMNETLNVGGAIRLGTTALTNAGTIRWNGTNFEGYTGAAWKKLDAETAGDVVGPGAATNSGVCLFDGVTGKLIKDSTRLVEDTLTRGSNLPDGLAVDNYAGAVNVRGYGAVGNGTTNDTTAINNAILAASTAGKVVYFPPGIYLITSTLTIDHNTRGCHGLVGLSSNDCILYSTSNIPFVTINTTSGRVDELDIRNLTFRSNCSGTRTSTCGLRFIGGNYNFNYNKFTHLRFIGIYYGIHNERSTGTNGGMHDWNQYTNLEFANYGAYNVEYGIKFDRGSGTGNVFSIMTIDADTSCIEIGGGAGSEAVGDLLFSQLHCGSGTDGIKIVSGGNYGERIAVAGCQFDAGVTNGLNFHTCTHFNVLTTLFGGASGPVFTSCSDYMITGTATNCHHLRIDGTDPKIVFSGSGVEQSSLFTFGGETYCDYQGNFYFRSGIGGSNRIQFTAAGDLHLDGTVTENAWSLPAKEVAAEKWDMLSSCQDAFSGHDGSKLHPLLRKKDGGKSPSEIIQVLVECVTNLRREVNGLQERIS